MKYRKKKKENSTNAKIITFAVLYHALLYKLRVFPMVDGSVVTLYPHYVKLASH
jgi:hypothetical protein